MAWFIYSSPNIIGYQTLDLDVVASGMELHILIDMTQVWNYGDNQDALHVLENYIVYSTWVDKAYWGYSFGECDI